MMLSDNRGMMTNAALEDFLAETIRELTGDDYCLADIAIVGDNARLPLRSAPSPRKAISLPLHVSRWQTSSGSSSAASSKADFLAKPVSTTDISPCSSFSSSRWDRMTNHCVAKDSSSSLSIPERKEEFDKFTLSKSPNYMRRSKRNLFMRSNSVPDGLQAVPLL
jgi:hypothetical protein